MEQRAASTPRARQLFRVEAALSSRRAAWPEKEITFGKGPRMLLSAPVTRVTFALLFPSVHRMAYAIIKTGGKQYRVSQGDVIEVEKLGGDAGSEATFSEVLLVADGNDIKSGDALQGATVVAEVVEQIKGPKVLAFKYRRRKGYHRTVGHRRKLTRLKIKSIPA